MRMNQKVRFINKKQSGYDPLTHVWIESDEQQSAFVNVTPLSYQVAYRDYGVTHAKMQVIRSLNHLPDFDEVEIDGASYTEFSRQKIGSKTSLIVKEIDA